METTQKTPAPAHPRPAKLNRRRIVICLAAAVGLGYLVATNPLPVAGIDVLSRRPLYTCHTTSSSSPYAVYPRPEDPFRFLPCTNATRPPLLEDPSPAATWTNLYEPSPEHWSWGKATTNISSTNESDVYAGRGIYLCGYLDVPLDWTNTSDPRITRLAVTKYQVAGPDLQFSHRPRKSSRTIVVEPGGPGGSGTLYVWNGAEAVSERLSGGTLDVLGWDPRGVNTTQPRAACFPHDADRDRWWQLAHRYRAVSEDSSMSQLEVADALFEATFRACWEKSGDLGRFVGTGMVARDLNAIRAALEEPQLTGYLVSYGTGIGQTYASMFPDHVGALILDGTQYVPLEWMQGGFGWAALANITDAWRDGFLGECLAAGPQYCALAGRLAGSADDDGEVTLEALEARMAKLVASVARRPVAAYTAASGPSLITYSSLVPAIYSALYRPRTWPAMAQVLFDLEQGNATRAAAMVDALIFQYDPSRAPPESTLITLPGEACPIAMPAVPPLPSTSELMHLVVCADSYDAPQPADGLVWWDELWANMTAKSWIGGNSRFYNVLPCRHFGKYWPQPAGVYRGPLNRTLSNPVMLVAETHDPATPLVNGRRLAAGMGYSNARMIVHHGYGHASAADRSTCTDDVLQKYILGQGIPEAAETHCFADEKPYMYGVGKASVEGAPEQDVTGVWREHLQEMMLWNPGLARGRA
ncbi:alpha beta hydrolase family protein [Ophiostoma piceae UAMH 11346]|uniref:Alpha beta hydrolase family protein n=1 Tax=Ophiostoma piceae (strain UAMH 11346) TaxID=1262450 RepID=S3CBN1_OPHP1|nr:alpha beta hydrolase family protein [Ophiostoma piceae UAMH 11346]